MALATMATGGATPMTGRAAATGGMNQHLLLQQEQAQEPDLQLVQVHAQELDPQLVVEQAQEPQLLVLVW